MSAPDFTVFNVEGGFVDGILRGFRSTILTSAEYTTLSQVDTLEGEPTPFGRAPVRSLVVLLWSAPAAV